jgi:hypothetical protein
VSTVNLLTLLQSVCGKCIYVNSTFFKKKKVQCSNIRRHGIKNILTHFNPGPGDYWNHPSLYAAQTEELL